MIEDFDPRDEPPLGGAEVRADSSTAPQLDAQLRPMAGGPFEAPAQERFETGRGRAEE